MRTTNVLGALLESLFPRSNRALSESLSTEDYNELGADVQELNSRLQLNPEASTAPEVATTEASTDEATEADEAAPAEEVAPTEASSTEAPASEATAELAETTATEPATATAAATDAVVENLPTAAELQQLRADAAAWNAHKAEYGVLKDWYANATTTTLGAPATDARDAAASPRKSYELAPWNNR